MSKSAANVSYTYVWKIENFFSVISLFDERLKSPQFTFHNNKWQLALKKVDSENLLIFLTRSRRCRDFRKVLFIDIKFSILDRNGAVYSSTERKNVQITEDTIVGTYLSLQQINEHWELMLNDEVLTILCDITVLNCTTFDITEDILMLSNDMSNMMDKKFLSDFQVTVGNKLFHLHKLIFLHRGRNLCNFKEDSPEEFASDLRKSFDRPEHFEYFIRYLYSGKLTNIDAETSAHLQLAAARYHIYFLRRNLSLPVRTCVGHTRMAVERIHASWYIDNLRSLRVHGITDSVPFHCIKFKCCLIFRLVRRHERLLLFCRREGANSSSDNFMEVGIILNLEGIYNSMDCFRVIFEGDEKNWREVETNFAFRNILKSISDDCKNLTLSLQVLISDEAEISRLERFTFESEFPPSTIEDFETLVLNLKTLLKRGSLSDTILTCHSRRFKAHKAILSARSPVIAKIFEQQNDEQGLNMGNIEPKAVKKFLFYIYSATVSCPSKYTVCRDLYELSHEYKILGLKEKCSDYMERFICPKTFCNSLILADRYSDPKLKKAILYNVYRFTRQFLKTPEWECFVTTRPDLAGEVLIIVAIPLLIILAAYIIHSNQF